MIGILAKALLVVFLCVASLAAAGAYISSPDDLRLGHVLAKEVVVTREVVRGAERTQETVVLRAGDPIGPETVAKLEGSGIREIEVYSTLGASEGATETIPVDRAVAAQMLAMDAVSPRKPDDEFVTVARVNTVVTGALVQRLNEAGVERVRVNSFHFDQWRWRWWFLLGCAGMLLSTAVIRRTTPRGGAAARAGHTFESATETLKQTLAGAEAVLAEAEAASSVEERRRAIITGLDAVRSGPLFRTLDALDIFKTRDGFTTYARVATPLARGERMLYRAWSAAVDEADEESIDSLRESLTHLREAIEATSA